jgi:hypothetical protein
MADTPQATDGAITPSGTVVQKTTTSPVGAQVPTGAVVKGIGKAVGTG